MKHCFHSIRTYVTPHSQFVTCFVPEKSNLPYGQQSSLRVTEVDFCEALWKSMFHPCCLSAWMACYCMTISIHFFVLEMSSVIHNTNTKVDIFLLTFTSSGVAAVSPVKRLCVFVYRSLLYLFSSFVL